MITLKNKETGYMLEFEGRDEDGITAVFSTYNESWEIRLTPTQANELEDWLAKR